MDDLTLLRERVKSTPITIPALAQRAGVKERWLRTFVAGEIPEPGYSKIKRLQKAVAWAARAYARAEPRDSTTTAQV